jgi:hypothetical protein
LWNTQILQRTVNKFPNLEELWIVRERELKLDGIFHTLKQLNYLKRFDWTTYGSVDVFDDLGEVAVAGERININNGV